MNTKVNSRLTTERRQGKIGLPRTLFSFWTTRQRRQPRPLSLAGKTVLLLSLCFSGSAGSSWRAAEAPTYRCENGKVRFRSNAPLEMIEAFSNKLRGALDPENNTFAWSVEVKTFQGFNGPLQREHFNENYMETNTYPKAYFSGKLIEKIDFQQDGVYAVRAKGLLVIHGVEQERILKSNLDVKGDKLVVHATFTVPLSDHDIAIPKIVHQKIATDIIVTVDAELTKTN